MTKKTLNILSVDPFQKKKKKNELWKGHVEMTSSGPGAASDFCVITKNFWKVSPKKSIITLYLKQFVASKSFSVAIT